MTDPIDVSPDHLRRVAARLDELLHDAAAARSASAAGESSPSVADFPPLPIGQQAAKVWADARPVTTQGLRLVMQALQQTAAAFRSSANGYEHADRAGAAEMNGLT